MGELLQQIDTLLGEVYYMLDLLMNQLSSESKRALQSRIKSHLGRMWDLMNLLAQAAGAVKPVFAAQPDIAFQPLQPDQAIPDQAIPNQAIPNQAIPDQDITPEELSINNGKNGTPAYVAVNGIVYNMTDVPSWAAATHFGMSAGQDLTEEFLACHANQAIILSRLQEVGRLDDGSTAL